MPGFTNSDNKFGLTPFIVGQVLGDGCNYDTIQTAIDDCFAAGGGVVGIRSSTVPYVENLTMRAGVELYGFDVDGRLPSFISKVVIQGNHTFTQAGGFGAVIAQYITLQALAGDALTINATGGASAILAMKFSGIEAFTVAGQRAVAMNPDAAASCQFSTDNTQIQSDFHCFENIGLGGGSAFLSLGNTNSSTGSIMHNSGGGNVSITGQWTAVSANLSVMDSVIGFGNSNFTHSNINVSGEAFLLGVAGGSVNVTHCSIGSGAASGNWIDGSAGVTVTFGDILLINTAQNIGAAVTQTKVNWQPYAEAAVGSVGSNRGTSSYDSTQFQVTDGFVQRTASPFITKATVDGIFSRRVDTTWIKVLAWAGGGGAQGGTVDVAGLAVGGLGAAGGGFIEAEFEGATFPAATGFTIGVGGVGGAGAPIGGGIGTAGTDGTDTTVSLTLGSLIATGGQGGNLAYAPFGGPKGFNQNSFKGFDSNGSTGETTMAGNSDSLGVGPPTGGGDGGAAGAAFSPGANGGTILNVPTNIVLSGGLGGAVDGASGLAGDASALTSWISGGAGGGGGASSVLGAGGNGANGQIIGGGGGGGGGALTGIGAGGTGGDGSRGEVWFIEYF